MSIKDEISKLHRSDIYSLILFALYKIKDIPEYSTLSELAFILDKENLLKLCQYFGGITLQIPTIEELENMVYALILYEYVDVDKVELSTALKAIGVSKIKTKEIKELYQNLRHILDKYEFNHRSLNRES